MGAELAADRACATARRERDKDESGDDEVDEQGWRRARLVLFSLTRGERGIGEAFRGLEPGLGEGGGEGTPFACSGQQLRRGGGAGEGEGGSRQGRSVWGLLRRRE